MSATIRAILSLAIVGMVALGVEPARTDDGPLLINKHQAAGLTCAQCHRESPPRSLPANSVCVGCHGDQAKLAALTTKSDPNPHAPPHLPAGETQVCADCHHVHKQSEVSCSDCHRSFHFNIK